MLSSVLVALVAASSSALAAPGVSLAFSGSREVNDVDNFSVTATVTNTGDETLNLLNDPNSILTTNWNTKSFDIVSAEGVVPEFKGVKVKYAAKAAAAKKSYTTLAPGESIELSHTLGGVYNFSSAGASSYTVSPSRQAHLFTHVTPSGELTTIEATVDTVHTAELKGKIVPSSYVGRKTASSNFDKRANSFVSCSSSRQTLLKAAAGSAQTYATNAYTYLTGISASTTRYKTWFGTYSSSNKATVQSHYSKISNGQLASDTFDCTCTDSDTYAYVYPSDFGYIYLCGYYWNAPATGTDSKAGTLVHESSHFTTNGGTDDYVYGQSSCKSLATSNPSEAIFNADSHEYFAENNPSQS